MSFSSCVVCLIASPGLPLLAGELERLRVSPVALEAGLGKDAVAVTSPLHEREELCNEEKRKDAR